MRSEMNSPKLYTEVKLTRDDPQTGLRKGDTAVYVDDLPRHDGREAGVVLEIYNPPRNSAGIALVPKSAITAVDTKD